MTLIISLTVSNETKIIITRAVLSDLALAQRLSCHWLIFFSDIHIILRLLAFILTILSFVCLLRSHFQYPITSHNVISLQTYHPNGILHLNYVYYTKYFRCTNKTAQITIGVVPRTCLHLSEGRDIRIFLIFFSLFSMYVYANCQKYVFVLHFCRRKILFSLFITVS